VDYFPSTHPSSLTLKIEYYMGDKKHRKIFFNSSIIFFMNYEKKLGGWKEKSRYQIALIPAKTLLNTHNWVNYG
jgi:hypothetical protein